MPGLGKTTLLRTLGRVLNLKYSRIQFTPDLLPGDVRTESKRKLNPVQVLAPAGIVVPLPSGYETPVGSGTGDILQPLSVTPVVNTDLVLLTFIGLMVGLGETVDDLVPFDPDEFVEALFS